MPLNPPEAEPGSAPCLGRVRTSLVWLGREVDDRSAPAMARWLALVGEEARLRRALA